MRKALNENPMVQVAVLGVCAIIFAVILFTSVLKKEETGAPATETPAAESVEPAPPAEAPATEAPAESPAPSPAATTPDTSVVTPPTGGTPADGLLPSKGLPEDVLVAFARNKTIALLIVDPKGLADKQLKQFTETLNEREDVEVFVVDAGDIARYARITQGVSVNRTPALVVIRPRKLTGSVPVASVSYGFRGPRSVNQAVDDAIYKGKQIPSYP